jgi:hypothetical protein
MISSVLVSGAARAGYVCKCGMDYGVAHTKSSRRDMKSTRSTRFRTAADTGTSEDIVK